MLVSFLRSHSPSWLAVLLGLCLTTLSAVSWAYCRTTTCDRTKHSCRTDPKTGCILEGEPLYWPDTCVTFGVHAEGSPKRGISYREAEQAAARAFQTWISVDCGGGRRPSIAVVRLGQLYCDRVEFNYPTPDSSRFPAPNANAILFRDDDWPHEDANKTLALTTVTFSRSTGEILDADIEINSRDVSLSTDARFGSNDLQSILTHEVGHFLGLDHSHLSEATMHARYSTDVTDVGFRSLHQDDERGVCAIYPPGAIAGFEDAQRDELCLGEGPRFGFSRYCGVPVEADAALLCNIHPGRTSAPGRSALGLSFGLACWVLLLRRRAWPAGPRV